MSRKRGFLLLDAGFQALHRVRAADARVVGDHGDAGYEVDPFLVVLEHPEVDLLVGHVDGQRDEEVVVGADHPDAACRREVADEHVDHLFVLFVEVVERVGKFSVVRPARDDEVRVARLLRVFVEQAVVAYKPAFGIDVVRVVGECRLAPAGGDVEAGFVGSQVVGVREREFVGADKLSADFQSLLLAVFGELALPADKLVAFGVAYGEYDLLVGLQAAVDGLHLGKSVLVERDGGRVNGLEGVHGGTACNCRDVAAGTRDCVAASRQKHFGRGTGLFGGCRIAAGGIVGTGGKECYGKRHGGEERNALFHLSLYFLFLSNIYKYGVMVYAVNVI